MVGLYDHFAVLVADRLTGNTSCNTVLQTLDLFLAVHECAHIHARDLVFTLAAVHLTDDQILGYVYQTSRQITGVRRTKGRIGQNPYARRAPT